MRTPPTITLTDGRVIELPPCPDCKATGKRCKRPSGHEAAEWHKDRRDALDRLIEATP